MSHPHFLPSQAGARVLLFEFAQENAQNQAIMVADLDTARRQVLQPGVRPFYSPSGHLVYQSGTDLWALPFSLSTLQTTGEAFPVAVESFAPSVAADGTLVYLDRVPRLQQLVWRDRSGERVGEIGEAQEEIWDPILSPDGQRVTFAAVENANRDVWIYHIERGVRTRVSTDRALEYRPVWSPTGEEIAFSSNRKGAHDIFLRRADGTGETQELLASPPREVVNDWSRDGQYLLYRFNLPQTQEYTGSSSQGGDLSYLKRDQQGGWKSRALLRTPFAELHAKFSPNSRFVAYTSDESGRPEVYVTTFPKGDRKWPISRSGGVQPRWSTDGKELFYVEGSTLVAVRVSTDPSFSVGPATRLFDLLAGAFYDVSTDGQRFIVPEAVRDAPQPHIRVVQNWVAEFQDRQ